MHNLLVVNGTVFPTPEGSFDVKYKDITNEYSGENGKKTVEIIRKNLCSISVTYNGLEEDRANMLHNVLDTVNEVAFYKKGVLVTVQMKLSDVSKPKKYYQNGLSVWGMSFSLEEL